MPGRQLDLALRPREPPNLPVHQAQPGRIGRRAQAHHLPQPSLASLAHRASSAKLSSQSSGAGSKLTIRSRLFLLRNVHFVQRDSVPEQTDTSKV
jgi:hypothetical protein